MNKKEIAAILKFVGWLSGKGITIPIKVVYDYFAHRNVQDEKRPKKRSNRVPKNVEKK